MLINIGLLLLIPIVCISGVPHRFVDVEESTPSFLRASVEFIPSEEDDKKGNLRDGTSYQEDDTQFSRAAVESVPATIVTYFQPLRSAVEYNPFDDHEAYDTYSKPITQKQKFLKVVSSNGARQTKTVNFDAYIIPTHYESNPHNYRAGSPYQQIVDIQTYQENVNQNQNHFHRSEESRLKMVNGKLSSNKVVCHITNWSFYRKGEGKFVPENLDPSLCTHIIYAYATLDPESLEVREFDKFGDIHHNLYARTINLDKNVPVLLGLGGWTDSSGDKYSRLVSNPNSRRNFVDRAIAFLLQYKFAGLHLDWNYPTCPQSDCRVGPASDRDDFTSFIQDLRKGFQPYGLLLTVSISGYKEIIAKAYDLKAISDSVEFMTIMTYDYHGSWEPVTGHVSPLFGDEKDKYPQYNTDYTLKLLMKLGAVKEKMILGIPFYGQTFTLSTSKLGQGFNSAADGPGEPGEVTNQPGMLAYNEICNRLRRPGWKKGFDPNGRSGPYATSLNQWVGYDDVEMVRQKTRYAIKEGYGGVAAWTVDLDDFSNRCCSEPFPLLREINREMRRLNSPVPSGNDCTRPPPPVTPAPPSMVATEDNGAAGIPTEPSHEITKPTTSIWWTKPPTTISPSTTQQTTTTRRTPSTRPPSTPVYHPQTDTTIPVPGNFMPVLLDGPCNEGGFSASPNSCNEYLVCSQQTYIQQYCPGGLYWNSNANHCDWPQNVQCSLETPVAKPPVNDVIENRKTTTPQSTSISTSNPTTRRTTQRITKPTTKPTESTTIRRRTTVPTTVYDTTPFYTTTSKKPYSRKPCENGKYYSHKDCSKYYICNHGKKTLGRCPEGTQFDSKKKICDSAENVKCVSKKQYLQLLNKQYRKSGVFNAALLKAIEGDPCENVVFVTYPGDCSSYLQCNNENFIKQECPSGLYFDERVSNCNWPQNVDCKYDSSSDEADDNEITDEEGDEEEENTGDQFSSSGLNENDVKPSSTTVRPSTSTKRPITNTNRPIASTFEILAVPEKVEPLNGNFKLVCYFTNWAWYRPGIGKYLPEDIDENMCTHIVYGFAVLNYDELTIRAHDSWADFDNKFYERVVAYKKKGVKVTLAIGGWNDSAGDKYSRLVRNPAARARFINHVIPFLQNYGFDGLDLDWEYPKCWQVDCTKGHPDEKQHFASFVEELSKAFKPHNLLLSSAVSPSKTVIDAGYDVPKLSKYFDWIAVMCYDYHGQWDKKTGHVAPLHYHPDDDVEFFNTEYTMNYWIQLGAEPSKLVMGMPLYGQSFTLADPKNNGLNAKAPGPGQAGEFTRAAGFLAYYEICDRILNRGWTVVQDPEGRMGPYAYKENQWVSFDDQVTLLRKTEFIKRLGIGGGMVWALDLDDFKNRCGQGIHPLLKIIHEGLQTSDILDNNPPQVPENTDEGEPEGNEEDNDELERPINVMPVQNEGNNVVQETDSGVETIGAQAPVKPDIDIDETPGDDDEYYDEDEDDEDNEIDTIGDRNNDYKVICYFTNWAWYRPGIGKFVPEDIDPELCTHVVYGFATLNREKLTIQTHDAWADIDNRFYERVVELKRKGVKVTVAIGGWNDSAGDKYSRLVRDSTARARFIENILAFISKYDFDGLDLDWEYPVCWQVECEKGKPDEKEYFAQFVEELSSAFRPKNLLLSAAVSPSKKVIDAGYDVQRLSKYFDWIAVMAYDYHGQWDKKTGHVAPMYEHPEDWERTFNANFSINYWLSLGADPRKIIMGMPMYGQSFSLADRSNTNLNSQTYGGGEAGPETRARGFLAYYEICTNIRQKNWNVVRDLRGRIGPYAYQGDQWVSFDDASMIRHKSEFVKALGLGGAMIWALDLDDFKNVCGCEEYPLLRTINRVLRKYPGPHNSCVLESRKTIKPTAEPTTKKPQTVTTPRPTKPVATTRKPSSRPSQQTSTTAKMPIHDDGIHEATYSEGSSCSPDEELFAPHQSDCNKYYQCNHGSFEEMSCPPDLHWNKDRCDWPKNSNCQSKPQAEEENNEIITSHEQGPFTTRPPPTQFKPSTTKPTKRPIADEKPVILTGNSEYKMVCYFTNWAWYRPGIGKYKPDDIDPNMCTHIVYGFAVLNGGTLQIKSHDPWADIDNDFYGKVAEQRARGIKVTIAIGGWNDSLGDKYSRLVSDPAARANFISHVISFIRKYNFDGLDLDWEYPVCWQVDCSKGKPDEKENFALFVKELSAEFKKEDLLLSAAVSPSKKVIDAGYDIPTLSKYFDWIAVMCYDYHGQWDKKTGHVAPLYEHPDDWETTFNANFSIRYWISKGAPPQKLVMGMPMYGQSFTLEKSNNNELNAIAPGPGQKGEFTRAAGFLAFYEICDRVNSGGWTVVRDPEGRIGPYAYKDRQWVSYDDVEDIRRKTQFVKEMGLGGAMIWALDLDDFRNRCGCGYHPLLSTINLELGRISTSRRSDCT